MHRRNQPSSLLRIVREITCRVVLPLTHPLPAGERRHRKVISRTILIGISLVASASADTVHAPFNGKDFDGWSFKKQRQGSKWQVGTPAISADNPKALVNAGSGESMINVVTGHRQSVDIYSNAKFGSGRIEVEVMVPKGANSGIYVMGEYEVQVLDSYGKQKLGGGDMGAIYGAQPPAVNACKEPGQWQKYVIDFQAPTFDETGKKTANARFIKVELNGKTLHENVEMMGPTPSGVTGREAPKGPIMFQGDHGPVAYRRLRITERD